MKASSITKIQIWIRHHLPLFHEAAETESLLSAYRVISRLSSSQTGSSSLLGSQLQLPSEFRPLTLLVML